MADWLALRPRIVWTTFPAERMHVAIARKLKRIGVKRGVPDVLIFSPPPCMPRARGVAIELKRSDGGKGPSPEQSAWLDDLDKLGWVAFVANGAAAAIAELQRLGF